MKLKRMTIVFLITLIQGVAFIGISAQERSGRSTSVTNTQKPDNNNSRKRFSGETVRQRGAPSTRVVIPPVTILHNPEYISGEASINVAANSNPLIRIGIAQNGVTLIEFPSDDRFFAIHAGNSDLVTVEKSPSLKRDHHLILRAGSGFLVPSARAKGVQAVAPATSIIAQMDSGMAITVMIYPVPLLKQQAHRLVIKYDREEVITARKTAGLATNLTGSDIDSQSALAVVPQNQPMPDSTVAPSEPTPQKAIKPDYRDQVEGALKQALDNPKSFKKWAEQRHGFRISTLTPRELGESARLVVFAVRNAGSVPLRIIAGYPDLYVETLNERRRPVEAGTKIEKLYLASSGNGNLFAPGETRYFALAYEAPILGAQQHLKIVVAHMSAADEPAMADLTALAR